MKKLLGFFILIGTAHFLQADHTTLKSDNYSGYTKLMDAIKDKQSLEVVKNLVEEKGEDVNAVESEFLRCYKPVLRYALDRGTDAESVEIIKFFIKAGADVNLHGTYNRVTSDVTYGWMSLLSYAVIYSSLEIVQVLLDSGAQINKMYDSAIGCPFSPLYLARKLGKVKVAAILVQAGGKEISRQTSKSE